MHDFIVKRAVDFVLDLLLHSLRAPATNARHFYSCFQACILPPNFLTGSLRPGKTSKLHLQLAGSRRQALAAADWLCATASRMPATTPGADGAS